VDVPFVFIKSKSFKLINIFSQFLVENFRTSVDQDFLRLSTALPNTQLC